MRFTGLSPNIRQGQVVTLTYTDPTDDDDDNALQDAAGNDVASFAVEVTNNSTVTGIPGKPTGLTATTATGDNRGTQIELSWTAPADGGDSEITGYKIERSANGREPWTVLEPDPPLDGTARSYSDKGLPSPATRHYRVSAINSFGAGSPSDSASATTDDVVGPVVAEAEVVSSGDQLTITFNETIDPANLPAVASFRVTADGSDVAVGSSYPVGTTRIGFDSLTPTIKAGQAVVVTYDDPTSGNDAAAIQDAAGNDAASFTTGQRGVPAVVNGSTVPPTAPGAPALEAVPGGDTSIELTWDPPADNGGRAIASYRIEWSTDGNDPWTALVPDPPLDGTARGYVHTELAPGTTRHYRVRAKNEVGDSDWSASDDATTTSGAPSAPRTLTATAGLPTPRDGTTLIALAWTVPADTGDSAITGYRIEWSADGNEPWTALEPNPPLDGTARRYSDEELASETTRHYRVFAINGDGESPASDSMAATTADIVAPVLESANVNATGSTIVLTFDEAPAGGDARPGTDRFGVTVDGDELTFTQIGADAATRTILLSTLARSIKRGQTVAVAYTDPAGDDAAAIQDAAGNDAASFTTGQRGVPAVVNGSTVPPTAPGAPALEAVPGGDTSIELTWDPPADNGGRAIASYRIEWSTDGNDPWTALVPDPPLDGTARGYVHTELAPGTTRHYRVRAKNEVGDSDWSASDDATTTSGAPSAPRTLTATAGLPTPRDGTTLIALAWTVPADTGDSAITGYRIEWSADGNEPWTALEPNPPLDGTARRYSDEELASETTRHYRVFAINGDGESPASDSMAATTADIVAPVLESANVNATGSTIVLTFDEAPAGGDARPGTDRFGVTVDGDELTFTQIGADAATRTILLSTLARSIKRGQTVAVAYTDPAGDDAAAIQDAAGNDAASFTTGQRGVPAVVNGSTVPPVAPGEVGNLDAEPFGADGIRVSWSRPGDSGGSTVTGYFIQYSEDDTPREWETAADRAGNPATAYTDEGLPDDTVRHYRVRAINGAGNGAWSAAVRGEVQSGRPGRVTGLEATPNGGERIDLAWTAPADPGDSAITGYRIEWSPDGADESWQDLVANTGNPRRTYTDRQDLASETTRHYRVSAINDQGAGRASAPMHATTDDTVAPTLTRLQVAADLLVLTYNEPLDERSAPAPGSYTVRVAGSTAAVTRVEVRGSTVRLTLAAAVAPAAAVTLAYRAPAANPVRDAAGNPAAAIARTAVMTVTVPGRPLEVRARPGGNDRIALQWRAPVSNGGAAIAGYLIEVSTDGTSFATLVANHNRMQFKEIARSYEHTGLSAGNVRHYRVSAINAEGTGPASEAATGTAGPVNEPPIGRPAIEGTAEVGETVRATPFVSDRSGLTARTFTWQWIRVDRTDETDIPGATSRTYRLAVADAGGKVKVRVGYVDDTGYAETATSAAWPASGTIRAFPGVEIGAERVAILEGGNPAAWTVSLLTPPTGTVTVRPRVTGDTDVTVTPSRLIFTAANWNLPQTLSVTTAQDADAEHETATVAHRVTGADYDGVTAGSVEVAVRDDEAAGAFGSLRAFFRSLAAQDGGADGNTRYWSVTLREEHHGEKFHLAVVVWAGTERQPVLAEPASFDDPATLLGPDRALRVTGATVRFVDVPGDDYIRMELTPTGSSDDVTVTVEPLPCDAAGSICLLPDRGLSQRVGMTVRGAGDLPPPVVPKPPLNRGKIEWAGNKIWIYYDRDLDPRSALGRIRTQYALDYSSSEPIYGGPQNQWTDARVVSGRYPWQACTGNMRGCRIVQLTMQEVYRSRDNRFAGTRHDGPASDEEVKVSYTPHPHDYSVRLRRAGSPATQDGQYAPAFGLRVATHVGPPARKLHVADASGYESDGNPIRFLVRLSPAASSRVTVRYATSDGSAEVGSDYTGTAGTLTFAPGETEKTVAVPIIDDDIEDSGETFILRLFEASSGIEFAESAATGTIYNTESEMPGAAPAAAFAGAPAAGHGQDPFTLTLQFNHEFPIAWQTPADSGIAVTDGTLSGLERVSAGENLAWTLTVTPAGSGDVTVTLPATTDCAAPGAICNADSEPLAEAVTVTVAETAAVEPTKVGRTLWSSTLTVGPRDFTGLIGSGFGGSLSSSGWSENGRAHTVAGVNLALFRLGGDRPNELWVELSPAPGNLDSLTLHVGGRAVALADAAVTGSRFAWPVGELTWAAGDRVILRLVRTVETAAPGTVLSVADAEVREGPDAVLRFPVTLTPASPTTVTVDYATADGPSSNGASAGADYTETAGTLTFAAGETEKTVEVAVLDDDTDETRETLTLTLSNPSGATLADASATGAIDGAETGGEPGLTARFLDVPPEHDGAAAFTFELRFGTDFRVGFAQVKAALSVTGGALSRVRRLAPRHGNGSNDNRRWEATVAPAGNAAVGVSLAAESLCGNGGALCNANGATATVPGPAALSVADASVREAADAALEFVVTLSRTRHEETRVDYATADVTATAGADYTATSGTLVFAAGETAKTVPVPVLDDDHDDNGETLTLTLSNPQGARIEDGAAVGTIENADHMPKAWLSRFGRTVAEQVIDAVEARLRAGRQPGAEMTLAGQALPRWNPDGRSGGRSGGTAGTGEDAAAEAAADGAADAAVQDRMAALSDWLKGDRQEERERAGLDGRTVTERDLLTGTSFALTTQTAGGGLVSLWGRGAVTRFDGRERGPEGDLTLDGEVASAMLGADWMAGPWTAGLLLAHSRGEGGYRGASAGTVSSTVTGLYPYGRYMVNPRVTLWGVAGYGAGTLTLTPQDGDGKPLAAIRTDMELTMAAVGVRGVAVEAPAEGGFELAVTSDAMAVRTSSEKTEGLAAATADATRLRLGLEGSWRGLALGGGALTPRLEIGLRLDGGDAETGFGADIGGGLAWAHPERGIAAELSARGLLTHEADGFRETGISGALSWQPDPARGRGPKLTLTQSLGGASSGGMDALLRRETLAGLAANDNGEDALEQRRLELRFGYGFAAFGDRFTATPELGLGLSNGHREYTLGWRLDRAQDGPGALELALEASRREAANDNADPEHAIGFRVTARW